MTASVFVSETNQRLWRKETVEAPAPCPSATEMKSTDSAKERTIRCTTTAWAQSASMTKPILAIAGRLLLDAREGLRSWTSGGLGPEEVLHPIFRPEGRLALLRRPCQASSIFWLSQGQIVSELHSDALARRAAGARVRFRGPWARGGERQLIRKCFW